MAQDLIWGRAVACLSAIIIIIIIIIIIESYTKYNEKKIIIQEKMHKTHSHRQVNSVNYLELEQTAVIHADNGTLWENKLTSRFWKWDDG